jgi:hypothetical protein
MIPTIIRLHSAKRDVLKWNIWCEARNGLYTLDTSTVYFRTLGYIDLNISGVKDRLKSKRKSNRITQNILPNLSETHIVVITLYTYKKASSYHDRKY